MELSTITTEKTNMKWLEGLILLLIMIIFILAVSISSKVGTATILDEAVSMSETWTGSIDNLE